MHQIVSDLNSVRSINSSHYLSEYTDKNVSVKIVFCLTLSNIFHLKQCISTFYQSPQLDKSFPLVQLRISNISFLNNTLYSPVHKLTIHIALYQQWLTTARVVGQLDACDKKIKQIDLSPLDQWSTCKSIPVVLKKCVNSKIIELITGIATR